VSEDAGSNLSLLQFHHPDIPSRLGVFVDDLITNRRPRRVANERVQLLVMRQLFLLFCAA
jgi:hypothetical protein